MQPEIHTITGFQYRLLELKMLAQMARIAFATYARKRDAWRALRLQIKTHLEYKQATHMTKAVEIGGQVFIQLTFPRLGTKAMRPLVVNELTRNVPKANHQRGLNTLIIAITKKCPLQCAHCFEWDNLNQRENLSADDVLHIIRKFQRSGVASIELSGGEPLNRFQDLLQILQESDTEQSDFWLITSGYRLTAERAAHLKTAGLVGACISLDHWDPARHDAFRGMSGSFDWAMQAAKNARAAGLAVCFSLTAVREFCNRDDLMRYAQLAQEQGVHFIRILEPRSVGHFAGQAVELQAQHIQTLEVFVETLQTQKRYRNYPMVDYYAAHQRQAGCSGAGQRFLYVDTDGDMHACPFCQHKCGNARCEDLETGRQRMEEASGCHVY
jgi:MoaA/NifB/PqqE/SkfB family radical SAM enzyme